MNQSRSRAFCREFFVLAFSFLIFSHSSADTPATVVAIGAGKTRNDALEQAYKQAVIQAFGQYLEARTVVSSTVREDPTKTEQVQEITEQIIALPKGELENIRTLAQWKDGNIFFARIQASVPLSKVKTGNFSVRQLQGLDLRLNQDLNRSAGLAAAELFGMRLVNFGPDQFCDAEVTGLKSVVGGGGATYSLKIDIEVESNATKWLEYQRELKRTLKRVNAKNFRTFSESLVSKDPGGLPSPFYGVTYIGTRRAGTTKFKQLVSALSREADRQGEGFSYCILVLDEFRERGRQKVSAHGIGVLLFWILRESVWYGKGISEIIYR